MCPEELPFSQTSGVGPSSMLFCCPTPVLIVNVNDDTRGCTPCMLTPTSNCDNYIGEFCMISILRFNSLSTFLETPKTTSIVTSTTTATTKPTTTSRQDGTTPNGQTNYSTDTRASNIWIPIVSVLGALIFLAGIGLIIYRCFLRNREGAKVQSKAREQSENISGSGYELPYTVDVDPEETYEQYDEGIYEQYRK